MKIPSFIFLIYLTLTLLPYANSNVCTNPLDPSFSGTQFNRSHYCSWDVMIYPVSNYSLQHYKELHSAAQNLYMQVANRYYMSQYFGLSDPTVDCLGVARTIICAYTFSKCFEDVGDVNAVCKFFCDLWLIRCPTEKDLYNLMCFNQRSDGYCTYGEILKIPLVMLILGFLSQLIF